MLDKMSATVIIRLLDREIKAMQDNTHWGEGQEAIRNHCIHTMQNCKRQAFINSPLLAEAVAKEAEVQECTNF